MNGRFLLLLRFELRKLLARRLPLVGAAVILLLAFLAPWAGQVLDTAAALSRGQQLSGDAWANGWTALAGSLRTVRPLLILLLLVLSGSSLAEEAGHRTLQALLTRPVRRGEVLAAKLLAIWAFGAALLLAVVLAGALGGELTFGLYDVVDPIFTGRTKYTFGTMLQTTALATALTALPLLTLTALGLLVSSWFDHPGHASGAALGCLFLLSALSGLSKHLGPWLFVRYLAFAFDQLDEIANQYSGAVGALQAGIPWAVGVPLVSAAALLGLGVITLSRRDLAS